jgi:Bax protein
MQFKPTVRSVVSPLMLALLVVGCDREEASPYQLYKAYAAERLSDIALIDPAGVVRVPADFDRDYSSLPRFSAIEDTRARKQAFFDYLRPVVEYENRLIQERRALLGAVALKLEHELRLNYPERLFLQDMRERYRIAEGVPDFEAMVELDRRLDGIPVSLVLAQAALESGWGTSRFAREANNLFGQWCFEAGCGVVPGRRRAGAVHEVANFDSVEAAVSAYFRNINTHPVYEPLREIRRRAREQPRPVSGIALAAGLSRYSERGDAYIDEVRQVIRVNDLETGEQRG